MRPWNRRDLLLSGAAFAASGCMPKPPLITASSAMPVVLAGVLSGKQRKPSALPEGVMRRLARALESRKLVPKSLEMDEVRPTFEQKRGTPQRLEWLADKAGEGAVLLVELAAFYDTQIQGRLRWTVRGTLSLGSAAAPASAVQRTIDTAVFLQFLHQAEAEAALEAATTIERAAQRLLDDWLRAQG